MNKKNRTYLQMELEEATLESGRYNADYAIQSRPATPASLLGAFRSTAARLGSDFNLPSASNLGTAQLRNSSR
jgi:hypothetical protein